MSNAYIMIVTLPDMNFLLQVIRMKSSIFWYLVNYFWANAISLPFLIVY